MKYSIVFFLFVAQLFAHGVGYKLKSAEEVQVLSFYYADGTVMNYNEVVIHSPADEIEYQNGRTDRNGNFAFLPNCPGLWLVAIKDAQGHEATATILIEEIDNTLVGKKFQLD